MKAEGLVIQNFVGKTALHYAASSGNLELVKFMIDKNKDWAMIRDKDKDKDLVMIRDKDGMLPLHIAALSGHKEIVEYLYPLSNLDNLNNEDKIELLVALINSDLYDVALELVHAYKELAVCRNRNGETGLHALARKPTASSNLTNRDQDQLPGIVFLLACVKRFFRLFSGTKSENSSLNADRAKIQLMENIWYQVTLLDRDKIVELIKKPWSLIFVAAEKGNFEFLRILIDGYPDILREVDSNGRSIFHIAILNRQENIFQFINYIGPIKDVIVSSVDKEGNTMLHLAATQAPLNRLKVVPGAALQMEREVLWFEKVRMIVRPSDVEATNEKRETPRDLFAENHKELKVEGEKWMKDTANSCMLVATLVATVVFAAAFTVPGAPSKDVSVIIFAISDAVSLIFSAISILSFLSILTSNYEEEDFISVLPKNLAVGIASLFLSIASMMVVFCATSFIVFKGGTLSIPIIITLLASLPVVFFIRKHHRFFVTTGRTL
ncbi:Ankyrin repeat family protein [Melia azedarach]|nr:Ankyrin repeat family protein [Melia azedarach]